MPRPGDELRRQADRHEALAAELRRQADQVDARTAEILGQLDREIERQVDESWSLPSETNDGTLGTMLSSSISPPLAKAVRGRRFESDHPLVKKAKILGRSMPAVAAELSKALKRQVGRTALRNWYSTDENKRRVPRDVVEYFKREPWGIKESAWKNGIQD